jgi:hypothetical protein
MAEWQKGRQEKMIDILAAMQQQLGLIFAVPAAEVAFHPHDQNNKHEMFFTCDDLKVQVAALQKKGVQVGNISEEQWGARTTILLPGGGAIGLYQPKHPVTFENSLSKTKTRQTK